MDDEINDYLDKAREWFNFVDSPLRELMEDRLGSIHVQKRGRIKSRQSLKRKIIDRQRKDPSYSIGRVTDVVGFRFVCHFQQDVAHVVSALLDASGTKSYAGIGLLKEARYYLSSTPNQDALRTKLRLIFKERSIEAAEDLKPSRYTSVHLVFERKPGQSYEIQIRTVFEDAWAEIEHALKYKTGEDKELSPAVNRHLLALNTFVQACSEYSEAILLDSEGDHGSSSSPNLEDVSGVEREMSSLPEVVVSAFKAAQKLNNKQTNEKKSEDPAGAEQALRNFIRGHQAILSQNKEARYYIYMELGISLLKQKRTKDALECYETLLRENPNKALIYYRIANAYRVEEDFEKVVDNMRLVGEKIDRPENTASEKTFLQRYLIGLAHAHWRLKDFAKAASAIELLKKKYPEYVKSNQLSVINCLAYYRLEQAKGSGRPLQKRELKKSYNDLLKLGVRDGHHWEALDTFCLVCFQLGLLDEAAACAHTLDKAIIYADEGAAPSIQLPNGDKKAVSLTEINIVKFHCQQAWNALENSKMEDKTNKQ